MELSRNDRSRDWSQLPQELLGLITKKLPTIEDFVRFGAVCRSWQCVTTERHNHPRNVLPWLMLPKEKTCRNVIPWLMLSKDRNPRRNAETRGFFSLSRDKVYQFNLHLDCHSLCWGSPHGWLITVDFGGDICLLNPISGARILLPPIDNQPINYEIFLQEEGCYALFKKPIISSSPSTTTESNCVVMALLGVSLAFVKLGDDAWTYLPSSSGVFTLLWDIIYFDGQFYIMDENGNLSICEVGDPQPKITFFASPPKLESNVSDIFTEEGTYRYLVESVGELYTVIKSTFTYNLEEPNEYERLLGVLVYKLDVCKRKWLRVRSLGDRSFFISNNSNISISASDYPQCRNNCIYFNDSSSSGCPRMKVFNMEDETVGNFYDLSQFLPPLWIIPNLW